MDEAGVKTGDPRPLIVLDWSIGAVWKWVDNTKQIADGLTKLQSRQVLADILRRGVHALKFDGVVKAGKKQTQAERQQHRAELAAYANQRAKGRGRGRGGLAAARAALMATSSAGRGAAAVAFASVWLAETAEAVSAAVAVHGACWANEGVFDMSDTLFGHDFFRWCGFRCFWQLGLGSVLVVQLPDEACDQEREDAKSDHV